MLWRERFCGILEPFLNKTQGTRLTKVKIAPAATLILPPRV
jgi:hypothetical protein